MLPELDACGGHWGPTPESPTVEVYHYHVQDKPPFTFGCYGPNEDKTPVTVKQCRALYPSCASTPVNTTYRADGVDTAREYRLYCPCYDANGSNAAEPPLELPGSSGRCPSTEWMPAVQISPSFPVWLLCNSIDVTLSLSCLSLHTGPSPLPSPAATPTTAPSAPPVDVSDAVRGSGLKGVVLFMPDDLQLYWPEAPPHPNTATNNAVLSKLTAIKRVRGNGVTFTEARVAAPKCAPSRFSMLSGRYVSPGFSNCSQ